MLMDTYEECRAIAQAKLDEAKRSPRRRKSLTAAAEAWLLLAAGVEQTPAFDLDGNQPSGRLSRRRLSRSPDIQTRRLQGRIP